MKTKENKMSVTFIIPAYNEERTIKKCLESIVKQNCKKEVLLIDNNSTDKTREIAKKIKGVKVLIQKTKGAARSRNTGLNAAKNEYIAFVDADVILPSKDWITKALKKIKGNVIGVGGPGKGFEKSFIAEALDALLYGYTKKRMHVNSIATMDFVVKRKEIGKLRFNAKMQNAEDPEFNFRLIKKGKKLLYDTSLWVYHDHPMTLIPLMQKWYVYGRHYLLPYLLHKEQFSSQVLFRGLFPPVFILSLIASIFSAWFLLIPAAQLLMLLSAYTYTAYKIEFKRNKLMFAAIHTIKQMAQMVGIAVCLCEKRTYKALFKGKL